MKIRFHSDMDVTPMHIMAFVTDYERCDIVINRPAFATLDSWMKDTLMNQVIELAESLGEPPSAVIIDLLEWLTRQAPDERQRHTAPQ